MDSEKLKHWEGELKVAREKLEKLENDFIDKRDKYGLHWDDKGNVRIEYQTEYNKKDSPQRIQWNKDKMEYNEAKERYKQFRSRVNKIQEYVDSAKTAQFEKAEKTEDEKRKTDAAEKKAKAQAIEKLAKKRKEEEAKEATEVAKIEAIAKDKGDIGLITYGKEIVVDTSGRKRVIPITISKAKKILQTQYPNVRPGMMNRIFNSVKDDEDFQNKREKLGESIAKINDISEKITKRFEPVTKKHNANISDARYSRIVTAALESDNPVKVIQVEKGKFEDDIKQRKKREEQAKDRDKAAAVELSKMLKAEYPEIAEQKIKELAEKRVAKDRNEYNKKVRERAYKLKETRKKADELQSALFSATGEQAKAIKGEIAKLSEEKIPPRPIMKGTMDWATDVVSGMKRKAREKQLIKSGMSKERAKELSRGEIGKSGTETSIDQFAKKEQERNRQLEETRKGLIERLASNLLKSPKLQEDFKKSAMTKNTRDEIYKELNRYRGKDISEPKPVARVEQVAEKPKAPEKVIEKPEKSEPEQRERVAVAKTQSEADKKVIADARSKFISILNDPEYGFTKKEKIDLANMVKRGLVKYPEALNIAKRMARENIAGKTGESKEQLSLRQKKMREAEKMREKKMDIAADLEAIKYYIDKYKLPDDLNERTLGGIRNGAINYKTAIKQLASSKAAYDDFRDNIVPKFFPKETPQYAQIIKVLPHSFVEAQRLLENLYAQKKNESAKQQAAD